MLSLQVYHAVAARSASELLRSRCTLAAWEAHVLDHESWHFFQIRSNAAGCKLPATGAPPPSSLKLVLALVLEVTPVAVMGNDDGQ